MLENESLEPDNKPTFEGNLKKLIKFAVDNEFFTQWSKAPYGLVDSKLND